MKRNVDIEEIRQFFSISNSQFEERVSLFTLSDLYAMNRVV